MRPRCVFALALSLGLVWGAVMTPLAVPDEEYHYRVSFCLSNRLLCRTGAPTVGEARYFDFHDLRPHGNVPEGYARVFRELGPAGEDTRSVTVLETLPRVYLPMYLPQTLGLALGRALRLGFGGTFALGRLGNLLFYALCLALAAALSPGHSLALAAAGLLPMALHQAASFSYDAFLNGLALVYFAALLRLSDGAGPIRARDWRVLAVSAALLAPAKGAGVPLLMLVWLLPPERFASPADRRRRLWGLLGLSALTMAVFFLPTIARQWGDALNWEGGRNYTPAFVLAHPGSAARLYIRTLGREGARWMLCMAGYSLAGLTLTLPRWIPALGLALLPLAGTPESARVDKKARLAYALAFLATVLLCMTVMLFTWTSDTRQIIQGVQGRYFLPAAAPLSLALAPPKGWKHQKTAVTAAMAAVNAAAVYCVLEYTLG